MLRRLLASIRGARKVAVAEAPDVAVIERLEMPQGWLQSRLSRPATYTTIDAEALARVRGGQPDQVAATLRAAERILEHKFDLLGSGVFVPVDPERPSRDGYAPIDWYLDPVRNLRFPRGVPYKEWKLYEMRPGNADVKYPWELARCQHWPVLGQAYQLTRDERFAREIVHELDDFVEANPVGIGVNWTCTMDIAIRAANWAIGLDLIRGSNALDAPTWERAFSALFDHGIFIRGNLENTYEVTSNHFLSNVVGLHFVAAVFADLPAGQAWNEFVRTSLEQEIDVQVLPDGADFESSIPYHRLVAELFLGSSRLADFCGRPLSQHYRSRVRDMVAYLAAVTRPDGLMPQAGDADDGRLHVLGGYGSTSPQDGRHLFGPAATMFEEPAWARLGGDAGAWEAAWWGLMPSAPVATVAPTSRLFPDAGAAVMRAGAGHYLLVTNAIVGTKGFGNHKHNDQLSFEYHPDGIPLVIDPGSYVYTSDGAARNRFRSTASHNTIQIDGIEQNEMNPEWLFRLFESAHAEHVLFDDQADAVRYVGKHHGYERLPEPVTHERELRLKKPDGGLEFIDRLSGRGAHQLRWHFHLAPGTEADLTDETRIRLQARGRTWTLRVPAGLQAAIVKAEYSPSCGVAVPCVAIDLTAHVVLDEAKSWEFSITS